MQQNNSLQMSKADFDSAIPGSSPGAPASVFPMFVGVHAPGHTGNLGTYQTQQPHQNRHNRIKSAWLWLLGTGTTLLRRFYPGPVKPAPMTVALPKPKRERHSRDHFGAHYYLGDLLDQLDACFEDFAAMRKTDSEAADLFEKTGCSIFSSQTLIAQELQPHFNALDPPASGCAYLGNDDDEKTVYCRFIYFIKHARPINVQPSNHPTYRVGQVFRLDNRHSVCVTFYISVSPSGEVTVLKTCEPVKQRPGFVRMEWRHHPVLLMELADRNRREKVDQTLNERTAQLFHIVANLTAMKDYGMAVRVRKDNRVATFAVDMLRTPYFFADREKSVNENGRTRHILHIVRAHERVGASGGTKLIKAHFRGLRRFAWNGYGVSIGLPGLHHNSLNDLTASAHEEIDMHGQAGLTMLELAERLDRHMTAAEAHPPFPAQ